MLKEDSEGGSLLFVQRMLLIFAVVLLCCSSTYATSLHQIQSTGSYNLHNSEWCQITKWQLSKAITTQHQLKGQVGVESNQDSIGNIFLEDWIFEFEDNYNKWALYYNSPHLTGTDYFRILHKDFYSKDKLSFLYHHKNQDLVLLISEQVPIKLGVPSILAYFAWAKQLKYINWQLTGTRYDSGYRWQELPTHNWDFVRNWGDIVVLEGQAGKNSQSISGAYAFMRASYEERAMPTVNTSKALVLNSSFTVNHLRFRPGFRYIGENFSWPLTKTNRYAKDRVGFFGNLRYQKNPWQILYNYEELTNIAGTKSYSGQKLRLQYKEAPFTYYITRKWQPTEEYTLGYSYKNLNVELRSNGPQFRISYDYFGHQLKFASSSSALQRIEYRYTNDFLLLHYIYKIERPTKRNFSHFLIRIGEENRHFKVRYGESDNGQLASKFDHVPNLNLGWSWRW